MNYIYKISNTINNKLYIGQTVGSIEARFKRHINDAMSNNLDTHLARAIRKYGPDNFSITLVEEVENYECLNEREQYWISYYDSYKSGYNETIGGDGGNTYSVKTNEELNNIKLKIRNSKLGSLNPNARAVKIKNMESNEEFHFGSIAEVQQFFNYSNHNFITKRCNHKVNCLWQNKWAIAYEEDDYDVTVTKEKNNRKSTKINLIDLKDNKEYNFESYSSAERYFNLKPRSLSSKAYLKGPTFIALERFKITVLN